MSTQSHQTELFRLKTGSFQVSIKHQVEYIIPLNIFKVKVKYNVFMLTKQMAILFNPNPLLVLIVTDLVHKGGN